MHKKKLPINGLFPRGSDKMYSLNIINGHNVRVLSTIIYMNHEFLKMILLHRAKQTIFLTSPVL